jgi:hypothetical protein
MKSEALPHWKLERYLLGELPADQLEAIRQQEKTDALLRERLEALRRSNDELLEKYPAAWMARQMKPARTQTKMVGMSKWLAPAIMVAAALVMAPLYLVTSSTQSARTEIMVAENGTRIKGLESRLEVWKKMGDSAEKLAAGTKVRAGDVVQLRYAVPERCYGALLSVDGRGVVTIHLSGDSSTAVPLEPGKLVALDRSYQLDDAPKFETFFLVTARKDFDLAPLAQSLLKAAPGKAQRIELASGQQATVFTLKK